MSFNTAVFLVNVPALNPKTFTGAPQGVRFLDPGVAGSDAAGGFFRPDNLPMDEPVAQAMLAQFSQLARECKSLADISAFAPGLSEDFHSGTSFAIRDEIRAAQSGAKGEADRRKALSKAQTQLCLAWALEGQALELAGLEEKLDSQWSAFEKNLGFEGEGSLEEGGAALAGAKPDLVPGGPRVPAALLVESVLAFLPEDCGLFCADGDLLADWEEYGVAFAKASPQTLARFGLAGSWREAVAPGNLLCLTKRPDPDKPWLAATRLVVAPDKE